MLLPSKEIINKRKKQVQRHLQSLILPESTQLLKLSLGTQTLIVTYLTDKNKGTYSHLFHQQINRHLKSVKLAASIQKLSFTYATSKYTGNYSYLCYQQVYRQSQLLMLPASIQVITATYATSKYTGTCSSSSKVASGGLKHAAPTGRRTLRRAHGSIRPPSRSPL